MGEMHLDVTKDMLYIEDILKKPESTCNGQGV
jgi:hypothetical protein